MRIGMAIMTVLLVFWVGEGYSAEGEKVLARAGGEVITLQEFLELAPMFLAINPQGDAVAGKRKLLEFLITQVLLAQEAIRLGLDQDPQLQAKLKQARINIQAQAYTNQRTQGISIGDKEVRAFFESHQDEFQGRELKEVEGQIKAKLLQQAVGDLIKKTKTELWQREKVVIDEQLLKEVEVPQLSTVNP